MRRSSFVAVLAVALAAAPAAAQEASGARRFGAGGTVAVGVERLFGVSHASQSNGPSFTTVSLLGPGGLEAGVAPYSIPRVGVDWLLEGGPTLGLGAQFAWMSSDRASSDQTVLGLNPRVGFIVATEDRFALWPRVGLSYVRVSFDTDAYLLAASLDLQLVIPVLPRAALTVTPGVDVGVAATGPKATQFGLQFGVVGWL